MVEGGNSICLVRAISDSELFGIISGLKFICLYFIARILFSLFI